MTLNEKVNPEYEKWKKEAGFEEAICTGSSSALFKKNGGIAWTDESGKSLKALSNQKIWEAGYDYCTDHFIELGGLGEWNKGKDLGPRISLLLTHEELLNLIEHTTDEQLLQRLNKAEEAWKDFENSKSAEEIGG